MALLQGLREDLLAGPARGAEKKDSLVGDPRSPRMLRAG
jgi:hypothetical protein